jgi:hypothetical protein
MRIERLFRRFRDFRHILSRFETLDVVFAFPAVRSHMMLSDCVEHASADPSLMIAAAIPVQV